MLQRQPFTRRYAQAAASRRIITAAGRWLGNWRRRSGLEGERVVSADWVVSYKTRLLQLERQSRHYAPAHSRVTVRENERGELGIVYRGQRLRFNEIAVRPARPVTALDQPPTIPGSKAISKCQHSFNKQSDQITEGHFCCGENGEISVVV